MTLTFLYVIIIVNIHYYYYYHYSVLFLLSSFYITTVIIIIIRYYYHFYHYSLLLLIFILLSLFYHYYSIFISTNILIYLYYRNQLSSCLGALEALLEGEITRKMLATEKGILVELCNVLHRQLLSQEWGLLCTLNSINFCLNSIWRTIKVKMADNKIK